jgi:hypothetical protein
LYRFRQKRADFLKLANCPIIYNEKLSSLFNLVPLSGCLEGPHLSRSCKFFIRGQENGNYARVEKLDEFSHFYGARTWLWLGGPKKRPLNSIMRDTHEEWLCLCFTAVGKPLMWDDAVCIFPIPFPKAVLRRKREKGDFSCSTEINDFKAALGTKEILKIFKKVAAAANNLKSYVIFIYLRRSYLESKLNTCIRRLTLPREKSFSSQPPKRLGKKSSSGLASDPKGHYHPCSYSTTVNRQSKEPGGRS